MWISLLALLVVAAPPAKTKAAKTKATVEVSQARPSARQAGGAAFGELAEPALREALLAMGEPVTLGAKEAKAAAKVVAELRAGHVERARKAWAALVEQHHAAGAYRDADVGALVGMVLRESYLESNKDLQFMAGKVAFFNAVKRELRDELRATRDAVAAARGKGTPTVTVPTALVRVQFEAGRRAVLARKSSTLSLPQAEVMIEKWEQQLSSVGDDAQLANLDLQNALQKQQQTLQMMSNISKMLHDTAKAVVCKLAGTC